MRHRFPHITALCLCLFFCLPAPGIAAETLRPAVSLDHPATVGDGTAFPVTIRGKGLQSVTLAFLQRSITATPATAGPDTAEALVLLPVPLDQGSGPATITWSATFTDGSASGGASTVVIARRAYPVQKLTVEPKYVTPDPAQKERLERERKLMGAALATRSATRHWTLPLARPVPGAITSLYGLRRVLNGQPRNAHKGLDFRGAEGSPITATAAGTVVLTGDFYYAGKFVVVDHGLGVVSISMHMSEITARQGQTVAHGDVLGLVGSTGRSTGPHLHFGLSVLGQSVDALPLLNLTEADKAVYAAAIKNASRTPQKKTVKKGGGSGRKKSGTAPRKAGTDKTGPRQVMQ